MCFILQVIGIPNTRLGEIVCACVRVKNNRVLNLKDIQSYCQHKIAKFKIPEFLFVTNNFPKTISGKIQKFKLKELALQNYDAKKSNL